MTYLCRLSAIFALTALLFVGCDTASPEEKFEPRVGRGATVSTTLTTELSKDELQNTFNALGLPIAARYDVAVYTLVYETIDADGATTQASGALIIPSGAPGRRPLLTYQHGTITTDAEAPSAGSFEQIIGQVFAANGYVVNMPDLLGLGTASPGFHPYVHAATSASAVVDMLRATQDFTAMHGPELNDQLFITGYSQGGYTAMAAFRAIEADHSDEFEVTAAAPMAGPYDLSGTMAETFLSTEPHPAPYYLAYALLAYNDVYDLYASPADIFAEPYTTIPPLFESRENTGDVINAALPAVPVDMLDPELVASFINDPNDPLRQRLRENDVYDWTPRAPLRMYHCGQDQHVPPINMDIALQRFHERGATHVAATDPMPTGDHGTCIGPSLLLAKVWFDGMVD